MDGRTIDKKIILALIFLAAIAASPQAFPNSKEEALILTPKPGPEPRINGAKIFGVRPGSPFLFTIPATGDRPMTFAVDGLPAGLIVDPDTGRISGQLEAPGDLGGSFEGIPTALFRDGFDVYAKNELQKHGGPGAWNDPDYLLLGYLSNWKGQTVPSPLTPNEQYTHVSLWCLLAAPLIFSGDITRLDDFTLSLLTNDEVIEVDQDPLGQPGKRITKDGDLEVWAKAMEDGSLAAGLFNRGNAVSTVTAKWADLGISGKQRVRDLWRQSDVGVFETEFQAAVARHGVVLIRLWSVQGDSSFRSE